MTKNGERGLLMLCTGSGKGKTTAALGQIMRALGHGWSVCLIQFIKGSCQTGELVAAARFVDLLEVHVVGRGFTWKSDDLGKDVAAGRAGWELAKQVIAAGRHRLVVLDELTYLPAYKMVSEQEVIEVLARRRPDMHVLITGRGAGEGLIQAADLVTEMRKVKHPYKQGISAQAGIEF